MHTPPWNSGPPYGPPPLPGPAAGSGPHPAPAGFGVRLGARIIDYLALSVFAFVFFILVTLVFSAVNPAGFEADLSQDYYDVWGLLWVFGWGLLLFFYDWLFHIAWGRTLGQLTLSLKVVRAADGGRLSQGQAVGRAAIFGLPHSVLCVGHVWVLVDCAFAGSDSHLGQSLHDRAAGTMVIRTRPAPARPAPYF
ncbi:RDD family protein [Nocardiopsis gilva YIM 90087]|uniref:RDD family protein n=1 Tax=Nocardiopsis gilva YIM 90087 TaxID=1235441 RepID=A0A223S2Z4_9ACTN|nr:RDD family protein [Nocardiopsis gilva]ASU82503.1 RDD family protein [Nocardiopsis gilva YIM 90087]